MKLQKNTTTVNITIITVSHNSADTIADTLRSVGCQTCLPVEHIVVDGASTDCTMDVINKYSGSMVRAISTPDSGMYDAMNKGIKMATGDIIGILNADDVYARNTVLETVVGIFTDPGLDCCFGDLEYVDRNDLDRVIRYWRSCDFSRELVYKGWFPPHPTFFVRKRLYDLWGGFDLNFKLAADVELMWRFLVRYGASSRYLPEVLVKMRVGGTSNAKWSTVIRQNIWLYRALRKNHIPHSSIFPLYKLPSRLGQFFSARRLRKQPDSVRE